MCPNKGRPIIFIFKNLRFGKTNLGVEPLSGNEPLQKKHRLAEQSLQAYRVGGCQGPAPHGWNTTTRIARRQALDLWFRVGVSWSSFRVGRNRVPKTNCIRTTDVRRINNSYGNVWFEIEDDRATSDQGNMFRGKGIEGSKQTHKHLVATATYYDAEGIHSTTDYNRI